MHTSDDELLTQLKLKNSQAFSELYERYREGILRYSFRLLQDYQNAEDATHNTFLKAHDAILQAKKGDSLKAWIFTIARNEVYGQFRKQKLNGILDLDVVSTSDDPHEELVHKEESDLVLTFLAELSPAYREALVLREYEQLTYDQIAQVTNSTLSSVESRIFKARKALAKKLSPYFT